MDLDERVRELERRVEALEAAAPSRVPAPPDEEAAPFWALEELKVRVGPPGAVLFTGSVQLPTKERAEWQQGATTEALLAADWALGADVLAALGHQVRLVLLQEVLRGRRTVNELGAVEGLGTSGQLYHHLRQLVAAGWLRSTGRGRYEVPATRVVPLLVAIAVAQR